MKIRSFAAVVVLVCLFLSLGHLPCAAAFFTDTGGHWADSEISTLTSRGYISGYPDGTFRPDLAMTRAEFITLLLAVEGIKPAQLFGPLHGQHWAHNHIDEAARQGIIIFTEYPRGFNPDAIVNRGEVAAMLARSLQLTPDYRSVAFKDRQDIEKHPYAGYIKVVSDQGILSGYPGGFFKPYVPVTRAQACSILVRIMHRVPAPQPVGATQPSASVQPDLWDNLSRQDILAVYFNSEEIKWNSNTTIAFRVDGRRYALNEVVLDLEGYLKVGGREFPFSRVELLIDGKTYPLEKVRERNGRLIFYCSGKKSTSYETVRIDGRRYAIEDVEIIVAGDYYDLDEIELISRNRFRVPGDTESYRVPSSSIKCDYGYGRYRILSIYQDTYGEYIIIETDRYDDEDEDDYLRVKEFVFYQDGELESGWNVGDFEIKVDRSWEDLADIDIIDENRFDLWGDTYRFSQCTLRRSRLTFTVYDTDWDKDQQTFTFYLEED